MAYKTWVQLIKEVGKEQGFEVEGETVYSPFPLIAGMVLLTN